jgi:hypothetical protein
MAAAMMPDGPNKMVDVETGETFVLTDVSGAGPITRIWMTTMVPPAGGPRLRGDGDTILNAIFNG